MNNEMAALHHLHGGMKGFDQHIWDAELITDEKKISDYVKVHEDCNKDKQTEKEKLTNETKLKGIKFTRTSADGEEGYPGELKLAVYYMISEDDRILMYWEAEV